MRTSSSAETCIIWVFFFIENLNENLNEVLPRLVRNRKPDFNEAKPNVQTAEESIRLRIAASKIQNNHRDHKDPGYCTNQNLLRRDSQKTEVDPAGNIENKSQHKEDGTENEKSRHAEENQNTAAI